MLGVFSTSSLKIEGKLRKKSLTIKKAGRPFRHNVFYVRHLDKTQKGDSSIFVQKSYQIFKLQKNFTVICETKKKIVFKLGPG